MIFVTDSQALYTDQGEFIKHVSCPLASRLARKISAAETEREFSCMHCQTKVKNLAYLTDQEALETAKTDNDVCFFATQAAKNVVHVTEPRCWTKWKNSCCSSSRSKDAAPCWYMKPFWGTC